MAQFEVRPAQPADARAMAELFAAVAEERTGIATEPPVDISERAALFARSAGESLVAVADGQLIAMLHIEVSRHGFGELAVAATRRAS
jgi:L-amino acid N-acyltransferase YncA